MSVGFFRFIGVVLILGSVGFATVKGAFTAGVRYVTYGSSQAIDVAALDRR
jgi:hypothetical protein